MRLRSLVTALALGASLVTPVAAQEKVLRAVPHADLTVLDPMYGTAWISLIHGVMVYESLFAWDSKLQPQPQMVSTWTTSPDGLVWRFTLRDGLAFHTGEPVTATDVIASARRWFAIDPVGGKVAPLTAGLAAIDAKTIEWRLNRPYPGLPFALASAPARFFAVMRAIDIQEPGGKLKDGQITNAVGSGPFKFDHASRVVGHRVVYDRNQAYVPRSEPANGLAGGRVVKVDKVEWRIIPDPATAAAALQAGEVDFLERPTLDLVPMLKRLPTVSLRKLTPISAQNMLRGNATQFPFNDARARLALAYVIDQGDEMAAGWGEPEYWSRCNSYFICGGPFGTEAGAENLKQDFAEANRLMKEAGYKGEKLVFVSTKEIATLGQMAEVAYDSMKRAGWNVEMVWTDWGTVGQLLRKKDSWHLFLTGAPGPIMHHPLTNVGTDMTCEGKNFVGWPCDLEVEGLRSAFLEASDADRPAALDRLHRALVKSQPYRVLGQYDAVVAYRNTVKGLLDSPVLAYWNIEKP